MQASLREVTDRAGLPPPPDAVLRSINRVSTFTQPRALSDYRVEGVCALTAELSAAVLILEDDPASLTEIASSVIRAGCNPIPARTCEEARSHLGEAFIMAIVGLDLPDGSGLDVIRALRELRPDVTIIAMSIHHDFTAKIEAIRAGAETFIEKPVNADALTGAIAKVTDGQARAARVLIVEDDPVSARATGGILEHAGFRVAVLQDATRFEQEMLAVHPDLVIMDISMPQISGVELTRFLRQDPRFETVPVLYLTAAASGDSALQAAASGGENVMRKPPDPATLVSAVRARLRHFGRLRQFMDRDALTGTMIRRAFFERADEMVALARRQRSLVTLAMLDVDHFKAVNDTHGHPAGDRVLASLGDLLRRSLRATDVVGRVGGEEFAMLLPASDVVSAKLLLERLLEEFASIAHEGTAGSSFHLTFSAGVAQFEPLMSIDVWVAVADAALYEAKSQGRARVVSAAGLIDVSEVSGTIDRDVIEGLARVSGPSADLVREIIDLFEEVVPAHLQTLTAALRNRDGEGVTRSTHALRSSCGNAGARKMADLCTAIDHAAQGEEWALAEQQLEELGSSFAETLSELRQAAGARTRYEGA